MKKKALIWFCGTSTENNATKALLNISPDIRSCFIDGVATTDNASEAETMKESALPERVFNRVKSFFGFKSSTPLDLLRGYQERHQEVQQIKAIDFLNDVLDDESIEDNSLQLVIGGHSRGAAIGMIGFLSLLTSLVDNYGEAIKKHPLFQKAGSITLIPVDPVSGSQKILIFSVFKNDLLQDGKTSVREMLTRIERTVERPGLFRVISFNARFDARGAFSLDENWSNFFREIREPSSSFAADRVQHFAAGFRHSAMVDESEEILSFYTHDSHYKPGCTPTNLLKAIVNGCLQEAPSDGTIGHIATVVRKIEVGGIDALKHGRAVAPEFIANTRPDSYAMGSEMKMHPGSTSLEELVKTATSGEALVCNGREVLAGAEWELIAG